MSDGVRIVPWKNLAPRSSNIFTKIFTALKARDIAQLVECLSTLPETQNMNSSITKTGCGGADL